MTQEQELRQQELLEKVIAVQGDLIKVVEQLQNKVQNMEERVERLVEANSLKGI